jgi:hypothetical protein
VLAVNAAIGATVAEILVSAHKASVFVGVLSALASLSVGTALSVGIVFLFQLSLSPFRQRSDWRRQIPKERTEAQRRLEASEKKGEERWQSERKAFDDQREETERLRGLLGTAEKELRDLAEGVALLRQERDVARAALAELEAGPGLTLRLENRTGDFLNVLDEHNNKLGEARYFHIHVRPTARVSGLRGRALALTKLEGDRFVDVARFKPLELTWDGIEGMRAEAEPDTAARLNLVCTESFQPPGTTIFCVEKKWHEAPRGLTTRIGTGIYRVKVRVDSDDSSAIADSWFEIAAPDSWRDLLVRQIEES